MTNFGVPADGSMLEGSNNAQGARDGLRDGTCTDGVATQRNISTRYNSPSRRQVGDYSARLLGSDEISSIHLHPSVVRICMAGWYFRFGRPVGFPSTTPLFTLTAE
jgi:hypothetical protein